MSSYFWIDFNLSALPFSPRMSTSCCSTSSSVNSSGESSDDSSSEECFFFFFFLSFLALLPKMDLAMFSCRTNPSDENANKWKGSVAATTEFALPEARSETMHPGLHAVQTVVEDMRHGVLGLLRRALRRHGCNGLAGVLPLQHGSSSVQHTTTKARSTQTKI